MAGVLTRCLVAFALVGAHAPMDARLETIVDLDRALAQFRTNVYFAAEESGKSFPAYGRWLIEVASAMRSGMDPADLQPRDPSVPLSSDAQAIVSSASAASAELKPFTAPPPPTKDLGRLAAYKQRTEPPGLSKVLVSFARMRTVDERAAAADHLKERYSLPR